MNYVRSTKEFTSEFVINSLPEDQQEYLLLKNVRKGICDKADVSVAVRGRVIQPRSDGSLVCDGDEKPLHLLITAKSKHQLTQAMQEIQRTLASYVCSGNKNNGCNDDDSLEDKITVGIDVWPAQFRMRSRILGENSEFVDYIENETGAIITLRGKGSNYADDNKYDEPLNVYIKHENPQMKEKTRELVLNLIETVQRDFLDLYAKYYAQPRKPEIIPVRIQGVQKSTNENLIVCEGVSEMRDFQSRSDTDKITVGFDCAPRNFDLKAKIYGPNYAHTEHIEKEGGALILLQGRGCRFPEKDDVDEPPHLLVKYQNLELKSKARELIFNLLESVQRDFIRLHGTMPVKPRKPQIVLYNPKPPQMKSKSHERSASPRRNSDHLRCLDTSPLLRYQNIPSLSRRSKTPPPSRRLNSPPPSRRPNSPPTSRRPNSPPTSRRPNSPPTLRRPNIPPVSRQSNSPPPSSRHLNSPPPIPRLMNTPPKPSRYPKTPSSSLLRRSNTSPSSSRHLRSPPRRPHSPPSSRQSRSPPMSKRPNSPPMSRRLNTSPKSSRRMTSYQHRSRSPVLAPPPPVISISENIITPKLAPLAPPVIPPLIDPTRIKPLPPPSFLPDNYIQPKKPAGNVESSHQWKMAPIDLPEPVQTFKSPEFYLMQPKQPVQFVVPSFTSQSNFGQQKYVKKREISPESSTNNAFTQSKKYCPPFSSVVDKKMDHVSIAESAPGTPLKQPNKTNSRVRHRSLVHISFKEEFAVPQESSKMSSSSTNTMPVERFNGYEYKSEDAHKFAIPTNANVGSRKEQNKQVEKLYHINDKDYYSSDSEDGASVICLDSEEDYYHPERSSRKVIEKPTPTVVLNNKPMTFDVKVQTVNEDEVLRNKRLQCICGNFTHFVTGVRSRAVQTEPERYCRY